MLDYSLNGLKLLHVYDLHVSFPNSLIGSFQTFQKYLVHMNIFPHLLLYQTIKFITHTYE